MHEEGIAESEERDTLCLRKLGDTRLSFDLRDAFGRVPRSTGIAAGMGRYRSLFDREKMAWIRHAAPGVLFQRKSSRNSISEL